MFWADKFADEIIKSGKHKPYHVDDMKTPSGRVHVGALRGMVVHGLIHQALGERGKKSVYTFVINDMDPMDGLPHYLPDKFKKYMGEPLYKIPSPEKGYPSMARCYGEEFIKVSNSLGIKPEIIWSSDWYQKGKFDKEIVRALDDVKKVRKLYHDVSGYDKPSNWYPYQVFCPKCGKVGSTIVTDWDGEQVSFECQKNLVTWAEGCEYKGKIEPKGDNGKLMWKMDWAAHWKVIKVTVEGAGKDHMSEGGSHDLSSALCEKVLDYPTPFNFLYEWFLAKGGTKMSSSKGIGVSAAEIADTLPAEILKFLVVKTPYRKAIVFDPSNNDSILDLFDAYDKAAEVYYKEGVKNPEGRAWELSQVEKVPSKAVFLPRFRDVVNYIQSPSVDIYKKFGEIKGSQLTSDDKKELDKRIKYGKIWLEAYAHEDKKVGMVIDKVQVDLGEDQKRFLELTSKILKKGWSEPDQLQQKLYDTAKENQINPRKAFESIYLSLTGKKYGPKAAWFLLDQSQDKVIERFNQARLGKLAIDERLEKEDYIYKLLTDSKYLTFSDEFKSTYSSAVAGVAVIRGINVQLKSDGLEQLKETELRNLSQMQVSEIDQTPEIASYKRMYKEMGVSWGSRKSSPAALLRRLAQGKGLYTINTCVDAYNLVVMKYRVSAGAFDMDQMKFPVKLNIAKGGEKALYIGDKEETMIKKGEVCYFDQIGPYNLDYNYRDAIRTSVTEKTRNIIINTEGVYNISRHQVEKSLKETIDNIIKYCGGKLITAGIVTAK